MHELATHTQQDTNWCECIAVWRHRHQSSQNLTRPYIQEYQHNTMASPACKRTAIKLTHNLKPSYSVRAPSRAHCSPNIAKPLLRRHKRVQPGNMAPSMLRPIITTNTAFTYPLPVNAQHDAAKGDAACSPSIPKPVLQRNKRILPPTMKPSSLKAVPSRHTLTWDQQETWLSSHNPQRTRKQDAFAGTPISTSPSEVASIWMSYRYSSFQDSKSEALFSQILCCI